MQPIQFFAARAEDGVLLPGATVHVFVSGTQTRAPLFSDSGAAVVLANPAKADGNARVFFYTTADRIDIQITYGGYQAPLLREIRTTDAVDVVSGAIEQLRLEMTDGKIYGSKELGLASPTVSNGMLFWAASSDAQVLRTLWQKVSSVMAIKLGDETSALGLRNTSVGSQDLIAAATLTGQALNGATAITENSKFVGFAIPAGVTGASSYITCQVPFGLPLLTKLVGSEVEITTQYEASAGFLGIYPITPRIRVGRGASYVDLIPNSSDLTQNGTVLTLRMRYTVTADDLYLNMVYQVALSQAVASIASSLKVKAVSYLVIRLANEIMTANDFMLEQRLTPLSSAITGAQASADSATISTGNLLSSVTLTGEALGGATFISAADGRTVGGLKIPTGVTGGNAYQTALIPVTSLVGAKLKFTIVYNATANFLTETTLSTAVLRVSRASGSVGIVPADFTRNQVGTVLTVTMSYTVLDGDLAAGALLQITPSSAAAGHDRTVELSQFSYAVVAVPAGSKSGADLVLPQLFAAQKAIILGEAQTSIASARLTSGDLADTSVTTGQFFNGGQAIVEGAATVGLLLPAGVTGVNSFIGSTVPLSVGMLSKLVGATIRLSVSYDTTIDFLAETPRSGVTLQVGRGGSTVNVVPASIATTQVGTVLTSVLTYVVTAADTWIKPVYQVALAAVAQAHDRTLKLKSLTYSVEALAAGTSYTAEDLLLALQLQAVKDAIPDVTTVIQIKVGPSGQYATPKLAMAAILDASLSKQYELLIDTSVVYDQDCNWSVKDYVHMTADGPGFARIHYENPDNVDPATIPLTQTFWDNKTSLLTRLKVTGRNVRYPIHSDSAGADVGRIQTLRQCWIEHLGNAGAQAYQDSISSGITVWASTHAWGCGTSSAQFIDSRDTVFRSPTTGFYFHTNKLFPKGCRVTLQNCRMLTTNDSGEAIAVQPLGTMQEDVLQVNGCELEGFMSYVASPWIPDTLPNQPANHSEIKVMGAGNTPFAFKITDFGRSLKIESNDTTASSKIEVSGDAVPIVFGRQVYSMPGVVGIKGYVYGWADISGVGVGLNKNVFITSLGQRLGDCTTVNKTLGVKINGGATTTITFNQNYTAQTNATILAAINSALGSAAVATAYDIGGRYRPEMLDEERSLKNNSAEGILMGMALAWDGHNKKIRKMTASDAPALFAGIAMEDIYPGQWGRVKTCGWILNTDLYQFTGSPSYHQVFYIDPAVPGKPTLTVGTNAIMRGKASNVVEVAPK
ncbi:hypothetical protein D3C81_638980 [compost metagenome]